MRRASTRCTLLHVVSALALAFASPVAAQVVGDYGDAPDGTPTGYPAGFAQTGAFPTTLGNDGARALAATGAHLGVGESLEDGAADPADPDGVPNLTGTDADDGVTGLVIQLVSIPPPAALGLNVSVPAGGVSGTYFLNVLIDLNMDGAWGGVIQPGVTEWPVQNFPVTVAAGGSVPVTTPFFLFGAGNRLPDPAWMRIAVTSTPVPANWTGTGEFASGEIEDHLVTLPEIANGKRSAIPVIECPPGNFYFRGAAFLNFECRVTNVGPAGAINWALNRLNGGVTISTRPPLAPQGPGIALAGAIPAGGGGVLPFRANNIAPLPSDWAATAAGVDPPSRLNDKGVIVGFGNSVIPLRFEDGGMEPPPPPPPPKEQQQKKQQEQKQKDKPTN